MVTIWEIICNADPVTMVTDDFAAAALGTVTMSAAYGLREWKVDGGPIREMPVFAFGQPDQLVNWFRESFPDQWEEGDPVAGLLDGFMEKVGYREIARALRTVQICPPEERAAYQAAIEAITGAEKLARYVHVWKAQRKKSVLDVTKHAWLLADRFDDLARYKERQSGLPGIIPT